MSRQDPHEFSAQDLNPGCLASHGESPRAIIVTFGGFRAVLIAIEVFLNITLHMRDDVVHIKLVFATALMRRDKFWGRPHD